MSHLGLVADQGRVDRLDVGVAGLVVPLLVAGLELVAEGGGLVGSHIGGPMWSHIGGPKGSHTGGPMWSQVSQLRGHKRLIHSLCLNSLGLSGLLVGLVVWSWRLWRGF